MAQNRSIPVRNPKENAQWHPQPGDRICICHKGRLISCPSKAFNLLRFSRPSLEAAPNIVLLGMAGKMVRGQGAWLGPPPPSVSPLGDKVGGASEKSPRAISTLIGSCPQPAGDLVTGVWGLISSLVRLARQTGPQQLDSWAHLAHRRVCQRVEPESHPRPSWCASFFVSLSGHRERGRKRKRKRILPAPSLLQTCPEV